MAQVDLRKTLAADIAQLRTTGERRHFIADLRRLADDQERLLAALEHEAQRPPALRLAPHKPHAGPGREPGDFIRIERVARAEPAGNAQDRDVERSALRRTFGRMRVRVMIGRALFYALESPPYISLELRHGVVIIRPQRTAGTGHFRVVVGTGMPRAWCDGARDVLKALADGRYAADVAHGLIRVGDALDDDRQPAALVATLEAATQELMAAWDAATTVTERRKLSWRAQMLLEGDPAWAASGALLDDASFGERVQIARAEITALTRWHAEDAWKRTQRRTS